MGGGTTCVVKATKSADDNYNSTETTITIDIARADQALYRAKDDGRNCVRIAAETAAQIADDSTRQNRVR